MYIITVQVIKKIFFKWKEKSESRVFLREQQNSSEGVLYFHQKLSKKSFDIWLNLYQRKRKVAVSICYIFYIIFTKSFFL